MTGRKQEKVLAIWGEKEGGVETHKARNSGHKRKDNNIAGEWEITSAVDERTNTTSLLRKGDSGSKVHKAIGNVGEGANHKRNSKVTRRNISTKKY